MGKPMGLDLNTVIEIIKLMDIDDSIETIENVMLLSRELVRDNG